VTAGSGGGFEGDFVAECFELADVVAFGAFGTDTGVVEAGAEVVEAGGGVGEQMPETPRVVLLGGREVRLRVERGWRPDRRSWR
jgi:hypothetical protein